MELKTPPSAKRPPSLDFSRVVSTKGFRKKNFPYLFIWVFYYAWVVSFATWWTASPIKENVFSMELRGLLHTVTLVSSAIFIFIIRKEWFAKTARIGAAVLVASIGLFLIAPNPQVELLCTVMIGIALGVVNTSILMPAVFVLNNTEKLYAIVGSNVLIGLISLFNEGNAGNFLQHGSGILLSFIILTIALGAIFFFKQDSLPADAGTPGINTPTFRSRIYLTLFF